MRLRLFRRVRQLASRAVSRFSATARPAGATGPAPPAISASSRGTHRRTRTRPVLPDTGTGPGGPAASGLATAPSAIAPASPVASAVRPPRPASAASGPGRGQLGSAQLGSARSQPAVHGGGRAAIRVRPAARTAAAKTRPRAVATAADPAADARPWFEARQSGHKTAGLRHCGSLEEILHRDWAPGAVLPAATVAAISRLAELPQLIKEKLTVGLDAIYVGPGGVPDLDDMGDLKGVVLPSGRATWDACAGAYGDRKIIVGSRPSPTPDVMCHEIGHALDDIDGSDGGWQSDSREFCRLYERCLTRMASEFHRQAGALGRREFFADSFAAIASGQRPALVEMLGGDTRAALDVMLYFNVRYGI